MSRILIVEDEKKIARFLELELIHEGYEVDTAHDGRTGLEKALSWQPDLMILDLMLPELSGIEVCRRLRHESDLPIIMLTAKDDVSDKVMGLDMGADDYMTKPFAIEELLARIRVGLKKRRASADTVSSVMTAGPLKLDPASYTVTWNGAPINLTKKEFEILLLLLKNKAPLWPGSSEGKGVLVGALHKKYDAIAELLLSAGADPNECDINGNSALMIAAANGSVKLVKLLMQKYSANLDHTNKSGENAIDAALKNGRNEIVKLLKKSQ